MQNAMITLFNKYFINLYKEEFYLDMLQKFLHVFVSFLMSSIDTKDVFSAFSKAYDDSERMTGFDSTDQTWTF